MMNFKINFEYPWLMLLLIPAALLTIVLYLRLNKKYRRNRNRIVSIILHSIVMLLCISVLAGMTFSYEKVNKENEVLILVDASESNEDAEDEKNAFVRSIINECSSRFKLGVVTFGYDQVYAVPLTYETATIYSDYLNAEKPDGSATDIAGALTYAKGLLTKPETAKIVLISDGVETDDSAFKVIKSLSASGIKVDTVYFPNEKVSTEMQVIGVQEPDYTIKVGDKFNMTVSVQSSFEGKATITLVDNGTANEAVEVNVLPGTQTFEIEHSFSVPGMHHMEFTVDNDADVDDRNNTYHSYLYLATYDNILIVQRTADEASQLRSLIDSENVKVATVSDTENMPANLDELRQYDQVILVNIANADMPVGFIDMLHTYVYDIGGGLLTVGGNKTDENGQSVANMYNRQDMYGTLYQQMLPVQAINYTPPLGVMIVIDRSGSMETQDPSTGRTKLELAKDGAIACLNALTERDYCGVMTLGDDFNEEVAITPVTERSKIISAVDKIFVGGNTIFTGALERAGQALMALTRVEKRHIILVTDGMPADSIDEYGEKIKHNYEAAGITLSIVSIGDSLAVATEMRTASEDLGHGRFYEVWDPSTLPRVMREDLNVPEIEEVIHEPFTPKISAHTSVVNGVLQADMPQLEGYYGTKLKEGAEASLTGEYVPIYAQWNYGEGVVGSFMCDLNGVWSYEFLNSTTGARIINNIVGGLFPMNDIRPQEIDVKIAEDNYTTQLSIFTDVAETETIEVTIESPAAEGETENSIQKIIATSIDYSRISFEITQPGLHRILVEKKDSFGNVIAKYQTYKTFSYSKEYDAFYDVTKAEDLMKTLAVSGNGVVVEEAYEIFEDFVRSTKIVIDPKLAFIIASIVLFLLDVAVRKFKFKWIHEIIRDRKLQKRLKQQ